MNLALTVLEIVAPVFILAGIGFTWVKLGYEYRMQFVTRLAMTLAVPCLIFTALMKTELDSAALGSFLAAAIVGHVVIAAVFEVTVRIFNLDRQAVLAPLVFGNTGNLGIPLAVFAFGEAGLGYAVVMLAVSSIMIFTYGIQMVAGKGAGGKALKEPMVWATLLGAVFLWQGWQTPRFLTNALDLMGQMAIPLMLLTLGVAIARLTPGKISRATLLSAAKFAVCAAAGCAVGWAFGLGHVAFGVLVLQFATPAGVSTYLLAEKYEADADAVAGIVVVSTVMAVGLLPLMLAFLL